MTDPPVSPARHGHVFLVLLLLGFALQFLLILQVMIML